MDPFKASQRLSEIAQKRTQLAGALDNLKKGTVISNLLAQSMGRPELEGQTATDGLISEMKDAYQKSTEAWDREGALLKPYAEAAPAAQPGARTVTQGVPAARGITAPGAGATKPKFIRNKTTGEVRKLNPATNEYEPYK